LPPRDFYEKAQTHDRTRSRGRHALSLRLLGPALESLAILYGKISDHRAAEARDVTAQMQQNLEPLPPHPSPRIEETLELLRSRFEDNVKSQH
jgi:hypothetical protein